MLKKEKDILGKMLKLFDKLVQKVISFQFTTRGNIKGLENWVDVPCELICPNGVFNGVIQYGVKVPIVSPDILLKRCGVGSKEEKYGFKPAYWFVGSGLKVLLRNVYCQSSEEIIAKVRNGEYTTDVAIKKFNSIC